MKRFYPHGHGLTAFGLQSSIPSSAPRGYWTRCLRLGAKVPVSPMYEYSSEKRNLSLCFHWSSLARQREAARLKVTPLSRAQYQMIPWPMTFRYGLLFTPTASIHKSNVPS